MQSILETRIKQALRDKKIKVDTFAKRAKVSPSHVNNMLNGVRRLNDAKAKKLLTKGLLLDPKSADNFIANARILEYKNMLLDPQQLNFPSDFCKIPLISKVSIEPPNFKNLDVETLLEGGFIYISKKIMENKKQVFAVNIDGSTMLIEKSSRYMPGRLHLFKLGKEQMLGRLLKGAKHYELETDKRCLHIPINSPDFTIVGWVFAKYDINP